jgi:hypothetical protein
VTVSSVKSSRLADVPPGRAPVAVTATSVAIGSWELTSSGRNAPTAVRPDRMFTDDTKAISPFSESK